MLWGWDDLAVAALHGTAHPSGAGGVVGEVLTRRNLNSARHHGQKRNQRSGRSWGPRRQELISEVNPVPTTLAAYQRFASAKKSCPVAQVVSAVPEE